MGYPSLPGYPQNSFGLVRCPDEPRKVLYSFVSRRESPLERYLPITEKITPELVVVF